MRHHSIFMIYLHIPVSTSVYKPYYVTFDGHERDLIFVYFSNMLNEVSVEMRLAEQQRWNKGIGEAILRRSCFINSVERLGKQEKKHECEVRGYWQSC